MFWKDMWNNNILQWKYPQLFFPLLRRNCLLEYSQSTVDSLFWLPLSQQAHDQLTDLGDYLSS